MQCGACGGQIGEAELRCPFCGVATQAGALAAAAQRQQEAYHAALHAQYQHHQEQQRFGQAQQALKRTANWSLYWGLAGMLFCCAFVPSLIAVVLGVRARRVAREHRLVVPTAGTVGLVLGSLGLVLGLAMVAIGVVEKLKKNERIESIEAELEGKLEGIGLKHEHACLLAELRLRKGDFRDSDNVEDIDCSGRLIAPDPTASYDPKDPPQAVLEGLRFEQSSKHFTVRACFEHGARWRVTGFRLKAGCDEPDDTAAPYDKGKAIARDAGDASSSDGDPAQPGDGDPAQPGDGDPAQPETR